MEIIQQIGSYAGLAAVVGLAILSALYFSQARDVKRLREWAGRAPDRAPVPYQPPPRVVAQPVQQPRPPVPPPTPPPPATPAGQPPPGAQPASPGAQPAPAQAAAAGATPAVARGPVAATPAAARAAEDAGTESAQKTAPPPPPPPRRPAQVLPPRAAPPGLGGHFAREAQIAKAREDAERVEPEVPGDEEEPPEAEDGAAGEPENGRAPEPPEETGEYDVEDADEDRDEEEADYDMESDPDLAALPDPEEFHEGHDLVPEPDTGEQRAFTPPPPPPPPPVTATRPPLPPRPAPPPRAQGPILPPYEHSRPGGRGGWESRRISPVKAGLAVGGTVLVVVAAAFGVLQMTGDDDGASETAGKGEAPAQEETPKPKGRPAVNPRAVTVSVLNGTTIGGLARKLGDRLEGQGFQLGNVTNNTDQQRAESVVLFAPGAEREAQDVGRRLKIDQREPIDPDSQTRAGDATVVVVAGADLDR